MIPFFRWKAGCSLWLRCDAREHETLQRKVRAYRRRQGSFPSCEAHLLRLCASQRSSFRQVLFKHFSSEILSNTVSEGAGLTQKSSPSKPILGYSDTSTVKLDFGDVSYKFVKYWAIRTMKWFRLRGLEILKSNKSHCHEVFDSSVTWERNMHIVAWVALESGNPKLQKYLTMQCIKEREKRVKFNPLYLKSRP